MQNQKGFTLVELLGVIIILGIIFSIVVAKFGLFEGSATQRMIDVGIKELNTREKFTWSNVKLRGDYSKDNIDDLIWAEMDRDLGGGTSIDCGGGKIACTINVQGHTAEVSRTVALSRTPAIWARR